MNIKTNITLIGPNFLTLILCPKTSLETQQTQLWPLYILIYTFMIKNKHKSGNNISSRDKIMINSSEVHFNITRQYPEVGLKNTFILVIQLI
jgi:hypothetical protein